MLRATAFALLAGGESPCDTEAGWSVNRLKRFSMGLKASPARWPPKRVAIKLRTRLNLCGATPAFIAISDGKLHDAHGLNVMPVQVTVLYVPGRGDVYVAGTRVVKRVAVDGNAAASSAVCAVLAADPIDVAAFADTVGCAIPPQ